jgi:hypothetical protein
LRLQNYVSTARTKTPHSFSACENFSILQSYLAKNIQWAGLLDGRPTYPITIAKSYQNKAVEVKK